MSEKIKPYFENKWGRLYHGDCVDIIKDIEKVDIIVTSPPYDNLRSYNGFNFDFESTAKGLESILQIGGVIVWVVGDATVNGSETGSSFRQALHFQEKCGLNIHDTMIWNKGCFSAVGSLKTRYAPVFEYMLVFSKGSPKTFNPIKDRSNKYYGRTIKGTIRIDGDKRVPMSSNGKIIQDFGQRFNIWDISPVRQRGDGKHPAPFPVNLAADHIYSWSNIGDTVFDPFMGSGTTAIAAQMLGRKWIGCEISEEYCEMISKRISAINN